MNLTESVNTHVYFFLWYSLTRFDLICRNNAQVYINIFISLYLLHFQLLPYSIPTSYLPFHTSSMPFPTPSSRFPTLSLPFPALPLPFPFPTFYLPILYLLPSPHLPFSCFFPAFYLSNIYISPTHYLHPPYSLYTFPSHNLFFPSPSFFQFYHPLTFLFPLLIFPFPSSLTYLILLNEWYTKQKKTDEWLILLICLHHIRIESARWHLCFILRNLAFSI